MLSASQRFRAAESPVWNFEQIVTVPCGEWIGARVGMVRGGMDTNQETLELKWWQWISVRPRRL